MNDKNDDTIDISVCFNVSSKIFVLLVINILLT